MQRVASSRQAGFTMIELIMVIVIIGILAAFALPRFANLGGEARIAAIKGAAGSAASAASIAHSAWLVNGHDDPTDMDGVSVDMSATGYPTADAAGIAKAAGIDVAIFVPTAGVFQHTDAAAANKATCQFAYSDVTGVVTTTATNCD